MNEGIEQLLNYLSILQGMQANTFISKEKLEQRIEKVCEAIDRGLLKS